MHVRTAYMVSQSMRIKGARQWTDSEAERRQAIGCTPTSRWLSLAVYMQAGVTGWRRKTRSEREHDI